MTRPLLLAALVLAACATPRPAQPVGAPVPPSQEVALATAGRTGAPPMTLVVPVPMMPAEPAGTGVGVRSGGGAPPLTGTPADFTAQGSIAWAAASHGPAYLAIPRGPGYLVEACGPAACVRLVSTDAGPDLALQRAGRIADPTFRAEIRQGRADYAAGRFYSYDPLTHETTPNPDWPPDGPQPT